MLFRFLILSAMISHAIAGEITIKECHLSILQRYRGEVAAKSGNLQITDFAFDGSSDAFMPDNLPLAKIPFKEEALAVYRRPGVARALRAKLFEDVQLISNVGAKHLVDSLKPGTKYTYLVRSGKISVAEITPGKIGDYASKHILLSGSRSQNDVKLAGEMWKDENGVLHIDANSGSYMPKPENLRNGERFFREHLGIQNLEAHYFPEGGPVQPAAAAPYRPNLGSMILNRSPLVTAHYFQSDDQKEKALKKLEARTIVIDNKTYNVKSEGSVVTEKTWFDTADKSLTQSHQQIRTTRSYIPSDKAHSDPAREAELARNLASQMGVKSALQVVKRDSEEARTYTLIPEDGQGHAVQIQLTVGDGLTLEAPQELKSGLNKILTE